MYETKRHNNSGSESRTHRHFLRYHWYTGDPVYGSEHTDTYHTHIRNIIYNVTRDLQWTRYAYSDTATPAGVNGIGHIKDLFNQYETGTPANTRPT